MNESFFKLLDRYPKLWNNLIGKNVLKNDKKIGVITDINYEINNKLIINNGERVIIREWCKDNIYEIEGKYIRKEDIESLKLEINILEDKISKNNDEFKNIKLQIKDIINIRMNYKNKFTKIIRPGEKVYKNHCLHCGQDIDSLSNELCINCGWYKCNDCNTCACNTIYMNEAVTRVNNILDSNNEARVLKSKIKELNEKLYLPLKRCEKIEDDNLKHSARLIQLYTDINFMIELSSKEKYDFEFSKEHK